jgi:hypothetical protein
MPMRTDWTKLKVRCAICNNFYQPKDSRDAGFKVCYDCKASESEDIKFKIKRHFGVIKNQKGVGM